MILLIDARGGLEAKMAFSVENKKCVRPMILSGETHFLLVGAEGFEPSAFCSRSKRATRLRYAPT